MHCPYCDSEIDLWTVHYDKRLVIHDYSLERVYCRQCLGDYLVQRRDGYDNITRIEPIKE